MPIPQWLQEIRPDSTDVNPDIFQASLDVTATLARHFEREDTAAVREALFTTLCFNKEIPKADWQGKAIPAVAAWCKNEPADFSEALSKLKAAYPKKATGNNDTATALATVEAVRALGVDAEGSRARMNGPPGCPFTVPKFTRPDEAPAIFTDMIPRIAAFTHPAEARETWIFRLRAFSCTAVDPRDERTLQRINRELETLADAVDLALNQMRSDHAVSPLVWTIVARTVENLCAFKVKQSKRNYYWDKVTLLRRSNMVDPTEAARLANAKRGRDEKEGE